MAAAPAAVSTPPAPSPSRTSCSNMRRTASPVILDMKGSLPTTRMVVLPETEPATRPPKASSIDLPSTVDEIRTLREELRLEKSDSENLRNFLVTFRDFAKCCQNFAEIYYFSSILWQNFVGISGNPR